jgi:hypothetical protein
LPKKLLDNYENSLKLKFNCGADIAEKVRSERLINKMECS